MNSIKENIINFINKNKYFNILITGPGGCGKTTVLLDIIKNLKNKNIAVCTPTGISAYHLVELGISHAKTLHSWTGLGYDIDKPDFIDNLVKKPYIRKKWVDIEYLIIDEISMVGDSLFQVLNNIGKTIRQNSRKIPSMVSCLPFGGVKLIMCGDFLQLPPVKDSWIFQQDLWKSMDISIFYLDIPIRFDDVEWYELLCRIRKCKCSKQDIKNLKNRCIEYPKENTIIPSILYSKKVDVLSINIGQLEKCPEPTFILKSNDYAQYARYFHEKDILEKKYFDSKDLNITEYSSSLSNLDKLYPKKKCSEQDKEKLTNIIPETINIRINAQIMIIKNIDFDRGIVNGTKAIINDYNEKNDCMILKLSNNEEIPISKLAFGPILSGENYIFREQYPITLAWAFTIHKTQSLTIESIQADLGETIFAPGQAYVVCSRVKKMENLYLTKFNHLSIKADKRCIDFDDECKLKSLI